MPLDLHFSTKILFSFSANFPFHFRIANNCVNEEVKLQNNLFQYYVKAAFPNIYKIINQVTQKSFESFQVN